MERSHVIEKAANMRRVLIRVIKSTGANLKENFWRAAQSNFSNWDYFIISLSFRANNGISQELDFRLRDVVRFIGIPFRKMKNLARRLQHPAIAL